MYIISWLQLNIILGYRMLHCIVFRHKAFGLCLIIVFTLFLLYHFVNFLYVILHNFCCDCSFCRLSTTVPSTTTYALSYGTFLGLYANMRYQAVCGLDRVMFDHFDVLGVYLFFTTAFRSVFNFFRFQIQWYNLRSSCCSSY